jgi:quercetin dioxygenase-like cupin family protein
MGIYRMYTGTDGQCHLEEQSLETHPILAKPQVARNIVFAQQPGGTFIDWHPAPRRQYVILLSGEIEIGFGDGSTRRFGPGDARLVEDTTGHGHTTKFIGDGPVVTAVISLA